jgi:hypothetical protein
MASSGHPFFAFPFSPQRKTNPHKPNTHSTFKRVFNLNREKRATLILCTLKIAYACSSSLAFAPEACCHFALPTVVKTLFDELLPTNQFQREFLFNNRIWSQNEISYSSHQTKFTNLFEQRRLAKASAKFARKNSIATTAKSAKSAICHRGVLGIAAAHCFCRMLTTL